MLSLYRRLRLYLVIESRINLLSYFNEPLIDLVFRKVLNPNLISLDNNN